MPTGIILSSGSLGATPEAIEKVLADNGYEPDKPEVKAEEAPVEPKRDDFDSDDAFETAQEEFEVHQEEAAAAEEERLEKEEEAKTERRPSRKQRAVEKATKQLRDELKTANDRLAALEGKNTTKTEVVKAPTQPKRDDFKNDAEFEDAMFDYRYKLRRAKETAEERTQAQTDRLKTNLENYNSQVETFKEKHDDWDDVVNQPIPILDSVYLAIQEQENGAAVTYYLGKHPDYAKKLADMTPLSAVMEVGRLSARLKTGAARPAAAGSGATNKRKPNIPEPVRPVSTSATSTTLTFREIAAKPNYPGKVRDLRRAQAAGR